MADPPIGEGWRRNPGRRLTEEQRNAPIMGSIIFRNGQRIDDVRLGGWRWTRDDPAFGRGYDFDIEWSKRGGGK